MHKFLLGSAVAGTVMLLTSQANAQEAPARPSCITGSAAGGVRNVDSQVPADAATAFDSTGGPGFLIPGLQLNADVEGSKTAQLVFTHVSDLPACRRVGQLEFGLTLNAPVDTDTGRGELISTSGRVPGGFGAEATLTVSFSPRLNIENMPDGFLETRYTILQGTFGFDVNDFKWRDPATFTLSEPRRTSYHASGSIGRMPNGSTFYAVGFRYERGFEAPKNRIFCQAAAPAPFECIQGAFGPPERNVDTSVFGLLRRLNPFGASLPMAMELRLAYDVEDDVFSVQAPLYFFLDSKRRYRGGIIAGWDSHNEDFRVGVFVGVPFDLFRIGS